MSWPVIGGLVVGLVVGINLGVLLMVALQGGRRQEHTYDNGVLLARIRDLETALERQGSPAGPTVVPGPFGVVEESPKVNPGGRRVTG